MTGIDIDDAIQAHTRWRRQFLNAFAGGSYADMPLSEHRGCRLVEQLDALGGRAAGFAGLDKLREAHRRFHDLANEIRELSNNGLGSAADLLLPELSESAYQLLDQLGRLRDFLAAS